LLRFAAPHTDTAAANDNPANALTPQEFEDFFQLLSKLLDDLLTLRMVRLGLFTHQLLPSPADGKPVFIQKAADLADDDDILALIIASIAAALYGLELRKLLFPVTQHVRFDGAKVADLANSEIPFSRYWRKFGVIPRFQHTIQLGPLVFGRDETLRHDAP